MLVRQPFREYGWGDARNDRAVWSIHPCNSSQVERLGHLLWMKGAKEDEWGGIAFFHGTAAGGALVSGWGGGVNWSKAGAVMANFHIRISTGRGDMISPRT